MTTPYRYEIEFDVLDPCRAEYDSWLSQNSLEWATHGSVASFEVRYNTNGLSPEVKLCFGFVSLEAWKTFVDSEVHTDAIESLRAVTTGLDGSLWERGSIRLDDGDVSECGRLSRSENDHRAVGELL